METFSKNPSDYILIVLIIISTVFQWRFLKGKVSPNQKRIYEKTVIIATIIITIIVLWTVFGFKNLFR